MTARLHYMTENPYKTLKLKPIENSQKTLKNSQKNLQKTCKKTKKFSFGKNNKINVDICSYEKRRETLIGSAVTLFFFKRDWKSIKFIVLPIFFFRNCLSAPYVLSKSTPFDHY
jgi:hypothetical protein